MKLFPIILLAYAAATGIAANAADLELQIQINNTGCYVESTSDQRKQPECDTWRINDRSENVVRENLRLPAMPIDPKCDICVDEFWALDHRLHFRNEITGDQARFVVQIMVSRRQRAGEKEFNISVTTVSAEDATQTNGASFKVSDLTAFRSVSLNLPRTLAFSLADQSILKINPLITIRGASESRH